MAAGGVTEKRLIVVLGMHRSGTSAITKSLELLGVNLGDNLYPASFDNPKGFWEDQECIAINEQLLNHLGSGHDRLNLAWDAISADSKISQLRLTAIHLIARKLSISGGIWGFKDPRMCRLLGFWKDVFLSLDCEVSFVIAVRNPVSVAISLAARNDIAAEKAYFLWLQHVLPTLNFMMGTRRIVVDYDELMANPYSQIIRMSNRLGLSCPDANSPAVKNFENIFLQNELRHSNYSEADLALDSRASTLVARLYTLLHRLATDQVSLEDSKTQAIIRVINERLKIALPAFDYINFVEDLRTELLQDARKQDARIEILNQQLAKRDEQVGRLGQNVTSRTDHIAHLKQILAKRNEQIAKLKEKVTHGDGLIARHNQALSQRDAQIASLHSAVAERDRQIGGLTHKINDCEQEVVALRSSTSWRITKPLRFLSRRFRRKRIVAFGKQSNKKAILGLEQASIGAENNAFTAPKIIFDRVFYEDRETILVVSHEASRTGAPMLSFNLVREFLGRYNVVVLLLGGGPLSDAFRVAGAAVMTAPAIRGNLNRARLTVGSLCKRFNFKFALINSIESRAVLPTLSEYFVSAISLIHEFASYTRPRDAFRFAFFWSGEVVFSAKLTYENALAEYPDLVVRTAHIHPQGRCLLPLDGINENQIQEEKVRIQHLIRPKYSDENAVIVLGAGFVQLRKGVDLFIECAARVVRAQGGEVCRFIWIGKGYDPDNDVGYSTYLADQIRRAGIEGQISFIDETVAIEAAYEAADLLLLSSRLDPLPNVAIDAMAHGVPVLCFNKTTGIADFLIDIGLQNYCVADYLDSADMAAKILALAESPGLRKSIGDQSRVASASYFNMESYVSQLEVLAQSLFVRNRQEKEDVQLILDSGLFRRDFSCPPHARGLTLEMEVRTYVRAWASGIDCRKPFPGFHPGIYMEQHGLAMCGVDPFADYLRAGCPQGPWNYPVIVADDAKNQDLITTQRVALHLHVYYPDLLPEIIDRLSCNRICPDLFVSINDENARDLVVYELNNYRGEIVDIQVVPNRGRDIGPFLTAFGQRILSNYDFVGHIHTKKSADINEEVGKSWYRFLLDNLLGGKSGGTMVDSIMTKMQDDPSIGMVFPDDPNIVGWGANYAIAQSLKNSIGLEKLPDYFIFPVGTMFWARASALRPWVDLKLEWSDYPEEPLPYDGTMLHAIERLFSVSLSVSNLRSAVSNVTGLTR